MITRGAKVMWINSFGEPTEAIGTVLYVYTIFNAPSPRTDNCDKSAVRYIVRWNNGMLATCEYEYWPGRIGGIAALNI